MGIRHIETVFIGRRWKARTDDPHDRQRELAEETGLTQVQGMVESESQGFVGVGEVLAELGDEYAQEATLDPLQVLARLEEVEARTERPRQRVQACLHIQQHWHP